MKRFLIILIPFVLIIAGCSHTVNVPLLPDYEAGIYSENQISPISPAITFSKGKFTDKRADIGTLATFKQGIHTYNLYEERPIDEALFEGLATLFSNSGHNWANEPSGNLIVNMQLLGFSAARNAGFINVGATSSIQIKLDFVKADTEDLLYSQIYNGTDERDQALVGLMNLVFASIDASIVNCINSVGDDESLANALKKL